ncbi:hypothetical protein L208DRAFT_934722 [Tricholoma matsutake]|nr:hypothetical protein L208DRAFT_934722 [Tricholoma matsutake 945]
MYTWDSWRPSTDGIEFCPMLWCTTPDKTTRFLQNIKQQGTPSCVMGFNEPDVASQCNKSPAEAAAAWINIMNPLAGITLLVSPATTNVDWMKAFLIACNNGCHYDVLAVHIYTTSFASFKSTVESYHRIDRNKKIWVTEFACQSFDSQPPCTLSQAETLMQDVMNYASNNPFLEMVFPFGAGDLNNFYG